MRGLLAILMLVLTASIATRAQPVTITRPADIVDLRRTDPTISVEMMYFSTINFLGRRVPGYNANVCLLTRAAAEALKQAQTRLKAYALNANRDLSLLVRDCYRPAKAVHEFVRWSRDPNDIAMKATFYPDLNKPQLIAEGYIASVSGHSRASSIDLTIVERDRAGQTRPLEMGTIVDFFGAQSHTAYFRLSTDARNSRKLLQDVLTPEFRNYAKEWWHFVLVNEPYPRTYFDFDIGDG